MERRSILRVQNELKDEDDWLDCLLDEALEEKYRDRGG
jgi:hypothetical protein